MSTFNFVEADVDYLFSQFEFCEREAMRLAKKQLPLPAYEHVMKASHTFNLLDARHAIGVTCLLYTSPSPRDMRRSRMPSSA